MSTVKKSIVLDVDKDLWRKFKSKTVLQDKKIGDLVLGWIKRYVKKD